MFLLETRLLPAVGRTERDRLDRDVVRLGDGGDAVVDGPTSPSPDDPEDFVRSESLRVVERRGEGIRGIGVGSDEGPSGISRWVAFEVSFDLGALVRIATGAVEEGVAIFR